GAVPGIDRSPTYTDRRGASVIADAAARLAEWWGPFLAFVAGTVSFASPCVFPLVPGYISFISGGAAHAPEDPRPRLLPMVLFIGPVLAGILAIAASQDTARGTLLLVCYSLGLGVPFLLVGFGIQRLMAAFGWVRRNYRWISVGSGLLLVSVGVLIATGLFTR